MERPLTGVTMSPGARSTPFHIGPPCCNFTILQPRKVPPPSAGSIWSRGRKDPSPRERVATTSLRHSRPGRAGSGASEDAADFDTAGDDSSCTGALLPPHAAYEMRQDVEAMDKMVLRIGIGLESF